MVGILSRFLFGMADFFQGVFAVSLGEGNFFYHTLSISRPTQPEVPTLNKHGQEESTPFSHGKWSSRCETEYLGRPGKHMMKNFQGINSQEILDLSKSSPMASPYDNPRPGSIRQQFQQRSRHTTFFPHGFCCHSFLSEISRLSANEMLLGYASIFFSGIFLLCLNMSHIVILGGFWQYLWIFEPTFPIDPTTFRIKRDFGTDFVGPQERSLLERSQSAGGVFCECIQGLQGLWGPDPCYRGSTPWTGESESPMILRVQGFFEVWTKTSSKCLEQCPCPFESRKACPWSLWPAWKKLANPNFDSEKDPCKHMMKNFQGINSQEILDLSKSSPMASPYDNPRPGSIRQQFQQRSHHTTFFPHGFCCHSFLSEISRLSANEMLLGYASIFFSGIFLLCLNMSHIVILGGFWQYLWIFEPTFPIDPTTFRIKRDFGTDFVGPQERSLLERSQSAGGVFCECIQGLQGLWGPDPCYRGSTPWTGESESPMILRVQGFFEVWTKTSSKCLEQCPCPFESRKACPWSLWPAWKKLANPNFDSEKDPFGTWMKVLVSPNGLSEYTGHILCRVVSKLTFLDQQKGSARKKNCLFCSRRGFLHMQDWNVFVCPTSSKLSNPKHQIGYFLVKKNMQERCQFHRVPPKYFKSNFWRLSCRQNKICGFYPLNFATYLQTKRYTCTGTTSSAARGGAVSFKR